MGSLGVGGVVKGRECFVLDDGSDVDVDVVVVVDDDDDDSVSVDVAGIVVGSVLG
jgi:hypothetical protein